MRLHHVASLAVALCATTLLLAPRAHAYRALRDAAGSGLDGPIRWDADHLNIRFYDEVPTSSGLTASDLELAVQSAASTWSAPGCDMLTVAVDTSAAATALPALSGDRVITVEVLSEDEWSLRGYDATAIATRDITFELSADERTATIWDADVLVNGGRDWSSSTAEFALDLAAAVTHELGHALGLDHPCEFDVVDGSAPSCESYSGDRAATMWPHHFGAEQATLSADDERGICAIYGAPACAAGDCSETAPSCAADADCAGDEICGHQGVCVSACPDGACRPGSSCELHDGRAECVPHTGAIGAPCEMATDCPESLCVVPAGASYCTAECELESDCPAGFACGSLGGQRVCVRPAEPSSCAVSGAGARTGGGWIRWMGILGGIWVAVLTRRVARRRDDDGSR